MNALFVFVVVVVICVLAICVFDPAILRAAVKAGAELRNSRDPYSQRLEFCVFSIGIASHDGGAEVRFYDDGIGVSLLTFTEEIFFKTGTLIAERTSKMRDRCSYTLKTVANNRVVYFPWYVRKDIVDYIRCESTQVKT